MVSVSNFQHKYAKAIQGGYAAVFAGAGISRSCGYVDWKGLLRGIASEIYLNVDIEQDLIAVAQYYCNEKQNRSQLNELIFNEFVENGKPNTVLNILSNLPIDTYWTTNYDHLIEDTLKKNGKRVDIKTTPVSLATIMECRDTVVYKMHGDYTIPESCVITKDDYEAYNFHRQLFTTALQGDLVSKTFLFIGFSFDDPNLGYILSRIRGLLNQNQREHYCLFEKPKQNNLESYEDFKYRENKTLLRIHDLQRYGINAVLIDSYTEIPQILEKIVQRVKTKTIFLSGSAETYGKWNEKKAISFFSLLTNNLCDQGYKIITGHGRGIGSYVISTILERYGNNIHEIERHLVIKAFPFQDKKRVNYNKLVKGYRSGIFQQAGTAIFFFGNKIHNNDIVLASGVFEEFELAERNGCYVIPIGSTGFMAKEISNKIYQKIDKYHYLQQAWEILNKSFDPDELVKCIMSILNRIQDSL